MNRNLLFISMVMVATLWACSSENSDDTTDPDPQQTTNDIARSIAEYPTSGTLLSSLSSSLSGEVNYNLTFESVPGAFTITTAGLTVADWLVYDYEQRTNITGTIEASNGTETETLNIDIEIDNVDDIWAFLHTSADAYLDAEPGEWIPILESEYNDLANYLAMTSKSGAEDSDLISPTSISSSAGNVTISTVNEQKLPAGSYLFAFKYYSWVNNSNNVQVKLSEGNFSGPFEDVGLAFPEHDDEYNHFVIKGADSPTTGEGYLGMYAPNNYGSKAKSGAQWLFGTGNTSILPSSGSNFVPLYQGLSSTLKQWD